MFFRLRDYRQYLTFLKGACSRYRVAVHAYVLMPNDVHLLMTPTDPDGISRVIQSVGRCYVQDLNQARRRSGTLWEGRHKASVVHADSYLIACHRYVELNPVRAGMVRHPGEYSWSSYARNVLGKDDGLIDEHPLYSGLGPDGESRRSSYRMLFESTPAESELRGIRLAAHASAPLGDEGFRSQIAQILGIKPNRPIRCRPRTT